MFPDQPQLSYSVKHPLAQGQIGPLSILGQVLGWGGLEEVVKGQHSLGTLA